MRAEFLLALVVLLGAGGRVLADHAELPPGVTPLEATWLWGHHLIPGSITRDGNPYLYAYPHSDPAQIVAPPWTEVAAGHVRPGAKAPAAVMLHGRSGMFRGALGYRVLLLEEGFAVFEPDAFARPGYTGAASSVAARRAEAAHALARLRELPWVDQDRVVLMGFSQGGMAVGAWREPGFAAHVILMAPARASAPAGVPVLSVAGADDSYARPDSYREVAGSGAAGVTAVLIPNAGHDILGHPALKAALQRFLREHFR